MSVLQDYGTDFSCTDDLNPNMIEVDNQRLLAESLYRRLISPRGSLYRTPEYGFDIRDEIGSEAYPDILRRGIEDELTNDERIKSVDATVIMIDTDALAVEYDRALETMLISITCTSEVGPFELVIGVDDVDVELLELA